MYSWKDFFPIDQFKSLVYQNLTGALAIAFFKVFGYFTEWGLPKGTPRTIIEYIENAGLIALFVMLLIVNLIELYSAVVKAWKRARSESNSPLLMV